MLYIIVVWILFVALLPFSASFVGEYGSLQIPNVFFDLNLFAIGFLLYINWRYALHGGLVEESEIKRGKETLRANLILPAISMVAVCLTFIPFIKNFGSDWINLIYAIIPFLQIYC